MAVLLVAPAAVTAAEDPVMRAMKEELARSLDRLRLEEMERPYFIAYRVEESQAARVSAVFGSLVSRRRQHESWLTVEVRVGSPEFDNTNLFSLPARATGLSGGHGGISLLPLDTDIREIRRQIWLATDEAYKQALEHLARKRAAMANKKRAEEIPDFSREEPVRMDEDVPLFFPPQEKLEDRARKLSGVFRELPGVLISRVGIHASLTTTRYLNSEGTSFVRAAPQAGVVALAMTQATDGMPLQDFVTAYARRFDDLPGTKKLAGEIRAMGERLARLQEAPLLERYNGPVLFEGQAAAELFAQVLAPRLLASRQPISDDPRLSGMLAREGDSFAHRIGGRVTARMLGVIDNPTLAEFEGQPLHGGYRIDDQGVAAMETRLIERGILKTLLSGRTPVPGVPRSSASYRHGGLMPGNMLVSAGDGLDREALVAELLLLAEERELEYALVVRRLMNPLVRPAAHRDPARFFFVASRRNGEVAAVIEAYKVFPDGREELVRNVEVPGLGPAAFKEIVAVSKRPTVHTSLFRPRALAGPFGGHRGAALQSADPVVSWVVPALLFDDMTLKKPGGDIPNPPALPHPYFAEER
jgi:hypothetical protein